MTTQSRQLAARFATLSKQAQAAIAASGIEDFTQKDAAERLLAQHGCARITLREIADVVAEVVGKPLGGLASAMRGWSTTPTMTTEEAARELGLSVDTFSDLAREAGVRPKRRKDGGTWSEYDLVDVRRSLTARDTSDK